MGYFAESIDSSFTFLWNTVGPEESEIVYPIIIEPRFLLISLQIWKYVKNVMFLETGLLFTSAASEDFLT